MPLLGWILVPTWLHFGRVLGSKLEPKSIKNRSKNQSYFWNPTWSQLGAILVQLMRHLVPTWPNLVPTWSQLGPNMVPKSQRGGGSGDHFSLQNRLQMFLKFSDRSFIGFESILGRFRLIFIHFSIDFCSMFVWFLVAFCSLWSNSVIDSCRTFHRC